MLPPELCLDDIPTGAKDSDGTLITLAIGLNPECLLVANGCLWVADGTISLEDVRSCLLETRTPLELNAAVHTFVIGSGSFRVRATFLVDFAMSLLFYLSTAGFENMASLLWRQLRHHWSSLSSSSSQDAHNYAHATFEQVVDVQSRLIKWFAPSLLKKSFLKGR